VQPDDEVEPGDPLAVLESMKMETVVAAPFAGRIDELLVSPNMQLRAGDPILRLKPTAQATGVSPPPAAAELFPDTQVQAPDPKSRRLGALDELRRLVLGYDVPAHEVMASLAPADPEIDEEVLQAELGVLRAFADITMLARDRRLADEVTDASDRSEREHFRSFLRTLDVDVAELPSSFREQLRVALAHHDVHDLERNPELEAALYRIHLAHRRASAHVPAILSLLGRWLSAPPILPGGVAREVEETLERLIRATELAFPTLGNLARRVRHQVLEQPRRRQEREVAHERIRRQLQALARGTDPQERDHLMAALVAERELLLPLLLDPDVPGAATIPLLEALTRRYYRERDPQHVEVQHVDGIDAVVVDLRHRRRRHRVVAGCGDDLVQLLDLAAGATSELDDDADAALDAYLAWPDAPSERGAMVATLLPQVESAAPDRLRRVTVTTITRQPDGTNVPEFQLLTFEREGTAWSEQRYLRGIHPMIADRLDLWRLEHFDLTRLRSSEDTYLFRCAARDHPSDVRLFAMGEVRDLTPTVDAEGRITGLPELERILADCLDDLRHALAELPAKQRPDWNRILLHVRPVVGFDMGRFDELIRALAPLTTGLGIEQVMVQVRVPRPNGKLSKRCIRVSYSPGRGVTIQVTAVPARPLRPLDDLASRVARARRRGTVHPAEVIPLLIEPQATSFKLAHNGSFIEHDLDDRGELAPVERDLGANTAGIVVGVVTTPSDRYPEGLTRVALLGDPTRGLGSLAEPECRRIISALELAQQLGAPVEWFAVSSGARIAMDSGTENMDWIGRVLRRIVEFTQDGGEINVVVTGINVGAQPYWNAEATMLMHTKGILVMTPDSTMVLTGKQALDYSGGVSAEDNLAIGGYERIMGPNGQAQYWAPDVAAACELLFRHYDLTYVPPGEHAPRRLETSDPHDRDVRSSPHTVEGIDFTRIGDIFSEKTNPGRKKPFDIRTLMRAVADQDREPLERWRDMAEAQSAVVLDAQLGGRPVSLLGVESRSRERRGPVPVDGPTRWTAGTLFPKASKKLARAINAASGRRPLVVLGNLSGFDGSPESLRELQLEFGAEIARAVVNFDGPIVFCVVSRYHGGAFVVFSRTLNDSMEIAALEGSRASVIGGAPAAAVVFAADVDARTAADPRILVLEAQIESADETERARLHAKLDAVREKVRSEKLGEVAGEFDAIHDVERAVAVGSIDRIISGRELRPYLIDAVEAGLAGYRSRTDR
jgi:acetyl-CoA carboxylase carboxyltransferase component